MQDAPFPVKIKVRKRTVIKIEGLLEQKVAKTKRRKKNGVEA